MRVISQQCRLTVLAVCKHCFCSGVDAYCAVYCYLEQGDAGRAMARRRRPIGARSSRSYCHRKDIGEWKELPILLSIIVILRMISGTQT